MNHTTRCDLVHPKLGRCTRPRHNASDPAAPDFQPHRYDSADAYEFHTGDRVRMVRDYYYGEAVKAGAEGVVAFDLNRDSQPYLSRTSHATSNGGGHDLPVQLDDGRRIRVRAEGTTTYMERI